ncbi:MAG TPA: mechanosensitive ion channel family protein [Acidimicrobiales bacterium]
MLLVGIGTALTFVGATVEPLTTAAIAAGVVAVLLLRGVATNFGAGLLLQTKGPFKPGDEVELVGQVGVVKELNGRTVVIESEVGDTVFLPNGEVLSAAMINRSLHGMRRSELEVRVPLDQPAGDIREVIVAAAASAEEVSATPAPVALTKAVEVDGLTLRLRFWHRPADAVLAQSQVIDAVAARLRELGVVPSVGVAPPGELPVLTTRPNGG